MFDPRGGYFKAGGVYMPSIVAELGAVIEQHLKMIGLMHDPELDDHQRKLIAEKRAAYEARANKDSAKKKPEVSAKRKSGQHIDADMAGNGGETARKATSSATHETEAASDADNAFPPGATLCHKCNANAVILMDGCATCLNCGYSKCG